MIFANGYIGKTITEVSFTKSGLPFVKFSVGESIKGDKGKKDVRWHQCIVFGDFAVGLVEKQRLIRGWECIFIGYQTGGTFKTKDGKTIPSNDIKVTSFVSNEKVMSKKEHLQDLDKANEIDEQIADEELNDIVPF